MLVEDKWRSIGHDHIVWQLVRYWASLGGKTRAQSEWVGRLQKSAECTTTGGVFSIDPSSVSMFFEYLALRECIFSQQFSQLRTEAAALSFCRRRKLKVGTTATQSKDHHQSSKALVATVTGISARVCNDLGIELNGNPQGRCLWCSSNGLHVTARNLDGAIPSALNPCIVWEIKEYWGKTSGGSKMSDAVYECHLVGREIRDFEAKSGCRIQHVVFVDGKDQWTSRQSDLKRFIDLTHQGFIDRLFVGKAVESEWEPFLYSVLNKTSAKTSKSTRRPT